MSHPKLMFPMTVVVDLDGTLFDISHRLHHIHGEEKDWNSFYEAMAEDLPIPQTILTIQALLLAGYNINFVTGREEKYRQLTQDQLHIYFPTTAFKWNLYMRPLGDRRQDDEVKEEIFLNHFSQDEYVIVFEDRQRVVDMYRKYNPQVVVCQVAEGNY